MVLTSKAEDLHATENVRCLKENWFNIAVYGEKLLLYLTLILKIIGMTKPNFESMGLCTMI